MVVFGERNSLSCRVIGQAEESVIRHIDESCALGGVLALILAYPEELDIVSALESFKYFKTGRTLLTVDINLN